MSLQTIDGLEASTAGGLNWVPTAAGLPSEGTDGQSFVVGDSDTVYVWDADTDTWNDTGVPSSASFTPATDTLDGFTPTQGQTAFTLSVVANTGEKTSLFINGVRQILSVDYSFTSSTLTWLDTDIVLSPADSVQFLYVEQV